MPCPSPPPPPPLQAAHASLDEKEKLEAKLKRSQHEYRSEGGAHEHAIASLADELKALETHIAERTESEEAKVEAHKIATYRRLKAKRDADHRRELKLGYLQNQVRGLEMEFQRLHRIMGVKFTPEKPESVQEIIAASLRHDERNASSSPSPAFRLVRSMS